LPFGNPGADVSLDVKQQVGARAGGIDHDEDVLDLFRVKAGILPHIDEGGGGQTPEVFVHTCNAKVNHPRLEGTP